MMIFVSEKNRPLLQAKGVAFGELKNMLQTVTIQLTRQEPSQSHLSTVYMR